jgi:DNA-binding NtrC family response regulator
VGSTFHVYLPAAEETPPVEIPPESGGPEGAGQSICIVDDEEIVGTCTKLALEIKGYTAALYSSAEQCLAALQAGGLKFDVLLTDQTMPGMQGVDLAVAVRKFYPDLAVVIMSGYFSKIPTQTLDELGRVELLGKPFTTDELALAIDRAIHRKRGA